MAAVGSRRPPTATLARRWLAVLVIALIGYAYYHPLRSWLGTRSELHSRSTEVAQLAAQERELRQRAQALQTLDSVAKQARQLGYIRPGEHLFIVRGIKGGKKAPFGIGGGEKCSPRRRASTGPPAARFSARRGAFPFRRARRNRASGVRRRWRA